MEPFHPDAADPVHARLLDRLRAEEIGWLGSTGRDGYPHAVPVWFLWHDDTVLIFSSPGAAKVKNLRADPRALFHLEGGPRGEHLQLLQGTVEFSDWPTSAWLEQVGDAFLQKYAEGIVEFGATPESFAADYPLALVFRPHKFIGW